MRCSISIRPEVSKAGCNEFRHDNRQGESPERAAKVTDYVFRWSRPFSAAYFKTQPPPRGQTTHPLTAGNVGGKKSLQIISGFCETPTPQRFVTVQKGRRTGHLAIEAQHSLCHEFFQGNRDTSLWCGEAHTAVLIELVPCALHFNILLSGNIHAHVKTCRGTRLQVLASCRFIGSSESPTDWTIHGYAFHSERPWF